MLISAEKYLRTFETGDEAKKRRMIDHMTYEQAELLIDNGYDVYLNDGEVTRVVSKDGNTTWYASGHNNN